MPSLPSHIAAMLEALKFSGARRETLQSVTDSEWNDLLSRHNFVRLTVPLRRVCGDDLPDWVRSRIDQNIADNILRFERVKAVYLEAALALREAGAEHLVVKGFTHWPDYVEHPWLRLQGDIDLFCPPESIDCAYSSLVSLGYQSSRKLFLSPADHLPSMARKTSWVWRGNFYDPAMPISFELHHSFWNETAARFGPPGLDQFWLRRVERKMENVSFPTLHPTDHLGYVALNVLRDILRSAPATYQVYELAGFLHAYAGNEPFWRAWRELHDDLLRRLEAISFRLALDWFAPCLSAEVKKEVESLPIAVQRWFKEYSQSPLTTWLDVNKDGLCLHLNLLERFSDKQVVFRERLFPKWIPPIERIDRPGVQEKDRPWARRTRYLNHLFSVAVHHARVVPRTLWHSFRLWRPKRSMGKEFWTFLGASLLFNFGMFIFFFLYNLYLLDRGFRENMVGLTTSAMAIGSIVGTIPAGLLAERIGLRKTLLFCMALTSLIAALRTAPLPEFPLLVLAFLAGTILTIWAVSVSPAITQLTNEQDRPLGFSLFVSSGIGTGIIGGQVGGRLPGWLAHFGLNAVQAKHAAILVGCGIVALAAWPISRLHFAEVPVRANRKKFLPLDPFLKRFLIAMAVWTLAVGAFSPFLNVYFSQYLRMPVKQMGMAYSVSHISQVLAVLAAPAVFRKFGLVTGIVYMQIATAVALICLAAAHDVSTAVTIYLGYAAFQWMSEPGMLSLLMSQVAPSERTSASALNFLVINVSQAIAAAIAGASFVRFGYPAVMIATAGIALVAAGMFRFLLGREPAAVSQQSATSLSVE